MVFIDRKLPQRLGPENLHDHEFQVFVPIHKLHEKFLASFESTKVEIWEDYVERLGLPTVHLFYPKIFDGIEAILFSF